MYACKWHMPFGAQANRSRRYKLWRHFGQTSLQSCWVVEYVLGIRHGKWHACVQEAECTTANIRWSVKIWRTRDFWSCIRNRLCWATSPLYRLAKTGLKLEPSSVNVVEQLSKWSMYSSLSCVPNLGTCGSSKFKILHWLHAVISPFLAENSESTSHDFHLV